MSEPARILYDQIEDIAVDDQISSPVSTFVNRVLKHFDAAEVRPVVGSQEFVVIAGDVDNSRALANLAEHLLHEIVMRLRPMPTGFQCPAVDDIADEIDRIGVMGTEEIEEFVGLRAAGS